MKFAQIENSSIWKKHHEKTEKIAQTEQTLKFKASIVAQTK